MEMKDVLHYYVGCPAMILETKVDVFDGFILRSSGSDLGDAYYDGCCRMTCHIFNIKPILKRLSDITEEDAVELLKLDGENNPVFKQRVEDGFMYGNNGELCSFYFDYLSPSQFHYLLSHNYDLFNLIDSGQAIDEKTVK